MKTQTTTIFQKHHDLYNRAQLNELQRLVWALGNDQPLYVCDVDDPDKEMRNPYSKAAVYPDWSGDKDYFLVGTDKVKKLFWHRYAITVLYGELHWEFAGDRFKAFHLTVYKPVGKGVVAVDSEPTKEKIVADFLYQRFNSPVDISFKEIRLKSYLI